VPITADPERLTAVASQLGAAMQQAERGERVRLPVIQHADAAGLVMAMHAQLDDAIEERSAVAAADGLVIACSAGCSSCCVAPVLVTEAEAVTVAEWLKLPEQAEVRARFTAKYPAWRRGLGDTVDAIQRATSNEEVRAAAIEVKRKAVMCAFNQDGLCSIYAARPARCRRAHALETNANCGADSTGEVKYFEHVRTEMTFSEQEPMRAILHHALRPNAGYELLCAATQRLLGGAVGRNDACPCGSGKKYKRCCGA